MPPSKVHRFPASFIKAGLVQQTHCLGRCDLGRTAVELALAAMGRLDLVNATAARGLGAQVPTAVRWHRTCNFLITSLGLGTTLSLLNSAHPRVFLAYSPRPVIEPLLRQERERAHALGLRVADIKPVSDTDFGGG